MKPIRLAWLNLSRKPLTSWIAFLAIAISVSTASVLFKVYHLSQSRFSTLALQGDAVIGAKAGGLEILLGALNGEGDPPDYLPAVLYQSLKEKLDVKFEDGTQSRPDFIRAIIPMVYFAKYKHYRTLGTDPGFLNRPDSQHSLHFSEGQWPQASREIILGSRVASENSLHLGDMVLLTPWGKNVVAKADEGFKVVGILESQNNIWDQTLFADTKDAQAILQKHWRDTTIWGAQVLNYFLVYTDVNGFLPLQNLVNKRTVAQLISITDEHRKLLELTNGEEVIGAIVTAFIILLGGLCVTVLMVSRFDSMNAQMAVLRAIGYRKLEVAQWLFWEGLMLAIPATLMGALLDQFLFSIVQSTVGRSLPQNSSFMGLIFMGLPIWIISIFATEVAVLIPVLRMMNQDVHEALKG